MKLIRFNIDLEEDSKSYEKQIGMSNNVEDVKGNPGLKGCLQLSNLRIVWHATVDTELNISIGFDTLISVKILSFPLQNAGLIKHVLTLKTISPKQAKYEFKFSGVGDKEQ